MNYNYSNLDTLIKEAQIKKSRILEHNVEFLAQRIYDAISTAYENNTDLDLGIYPEEFVRFSYKDSRDQGDSKEKAKTLNFSQIITDDTMGQLLNKELLTEENPEIKEYITKNKSNLLAQINNDFKKIDYKALLDEAFS